MNKEILQAKGSYEIFRTPALSEWSVTVFEGTILRPLKGKEPNFFWRQMQYLVFGFKWKKDLK